MKYQFDMRCFAFGVFWDDDMIIFAFGPVTFGRLWKRAQEGE